MSAVSSPRPAPASRDPRRPWQPSPFARLARTHFFSVAGDVAFTAALAGTVFFGAANLDQARWRVAGTLVFTIAPFAVAAPLIGPLIDRARGGRKWMILGLSLMRMLICVALVANRESAIYFYPEALLMLVFSKGYLIARGAIVPTTVSSDAELVEANSKLALLSGIAGAAGAVPAGILLKLGGPGWTLGFAALLFGATTVLAFQLPSTRVAVEPVDEVEREELRGAGIQLAARSMSLVRGVVGFLAFLLAFHFKEDDNPFGLGLALVCAQGGFLIGAALAPRARRVLSEERMFSMAIAVMAGAGILTSLMSPIAGAGLLALSVGITSNLAKQAFDAIVQRDAPDANRGRSFARFETRFQLVWVVGALIPVAIQMPVKVGYVLIAVVSLAALVTYDLGMRRARTAARPSPIPEALPDAFTAPPSPPSVEQVVGGRRRSWTRGPAVPAGVGSEAPGAGPDGTVVAPPHHLFGVPDHPADAQHLFGPDATLPQDLTAAPTQGLFSDPTVVTTAPPVSPRPTPPSSPPPASATPGPQLYDGGHDLDELTPLPANRPAPANHPIPSPTRPTPPPVSAEPPAPEQVTPPSAEELAFPEPQWREGETPPLPGFEPTDDPD